MFLLLKTLFIALFPVVALLFFIYFVDKYQKEPWSELLKAVAAGVLSALIALVAVMGVGHFFPPTVGGSIGDAFLNAAIPEELAKFFMLWLVLKSNRYFDEYFDGVVYAVCVGLGFAGLENILYLMGEEDFLAVGVARGVLSVPAHFLFAVAMGYYYALVHFNQELTSKQKTFYTICVIAVPVLLHGLFDTFLMVMNVSIQQWNFALAGACVLAFVALCIYMVIFAFRKCKKLLQTDKRMFDMLAQHQFNQYWTPTPQNQQQWEPSPQGPQQQNPSPQGSQQWNPSSQGPQQWNPSPQGPQQQNPSPQDPQPNPPQDETPLK